MTKRQQDTFTQQEISVAINNAMVSAGRPGKIPKGITESRARQLRLVSQALIEPLLKFIDDDDPANRILMPEELVFCLLGSAAFVQLNRVMNRSSMPGAMSKEIQEKINAIV